MPKHDATLSAASAGSTTHFTAKTRDSKISQPRLAFCPTLGIMVAVAGRCLTQKGE